MAKLNCLGIAITSQNFVQGEIKFVESLMQFTPEPLRIYHCAWYKDIQIKIHKTIILDSPPCGCKLWSRIHIDKMHVVYSRTGCWKEHLDSSKKAMKGDRRESDNEEIHTLQFFHILLKWRKRGCERGGAHLARIGEMRNGSERERISWMQ